MLIIPPADQSRLKRSWRTAELTGAGDWEGGQQKTDTEEETVTGGKEAVVVLNDDSNIGALCNVQAIYVLYIVNCVLSTAP
jgi:hypothetical protein